MVAFPDGSEGDPGVFRRCDSVIVRSVTEHVGSRVDECSVMCLCDKSHKEACDDGVSEGFIEQDDRCHDWDDETEENETESVVIVLEPCYWIL